MPVKLHFNLTDKDFPVSPLFIAIVANHFFKTPIPDYDWTDHVTEEPCSDDSVWKRAKPDADIIMRHPRSRVVVRSCYALFADLLSGGTKKLSALQDKYRFYVFGGYPRTGSMYLTAECYRALGYEPSSIPPILPSNDSFPVAPSFLQRRDISRHCYALQRAAEFWTIVDLRFGKSKPDRSEKIHVPLKLIGYSQSFGYYQRLLGHDVKFVIPLRNPLSCVISAAELLGGLPKNGKFTVRGQIDWLARNALYENGYTENDVSDMRYFKAHFEYWRLFHINLAHMLKSVDTPIVIPYTRHHMHKAAGQIHEVMQSDLTPRKFIVKETLIYSSAVR